MKNSYTRRGVTQHINVGQVLPNNQIKCHSRMSLSGIFNACRLRKSLETACVEDPRLQASGMTTLFNNPSSPLGVTPSCHAELVSASSRYDNNKTLKQVQGDGTRGFTLIELLVVVLIIGILAAVALPQYQKAVEKSKATQALTLLKALGKAADIYYLQNGEVPTKFEELDISLPADWTGNEKIYNGHATDAKSNNEWSIILMNEPSLEQVMVGKISGKYKGAAFGYYLKNDNGVGSSYTSRIVCKEIGGNSSYIYSSELPSYCQTFFGGKLILKSRNKVYEMP